MYIHNLFFNGLIIRECLGTENNNSHQQVLYGAIRVLEIQGVLLDSLKFPEHLYKVLLPLRSDGGALINDDPA